MTEDRLEEIERKARGKLGFSARSAAYADGQAELELAAEVRRLRWALEAIARRYERIAPPVGFPKEPGLAWAMWTDARDALSGQSEERAEEPGEAPRPSRPSR